MNVLRWMFVCLVTVTTTTAGLAHEFRTRDLTIVHPWARATMAPGQAAAVYMAIINESAEPDRLLDATTSIAGMAMLHRTVSEAGVARMIKVEELQIGAGGSVVLEPAGLHLMLTGLAVPLVTGESFPLTLRFERAGKVVVTVEIEGMESDSSSHAHTPGE